MHTIELNHATTESTLAVTGLIPVGISTGRPFVPQVIAADSVDRENSQSRVVELERDARSVRRAIQLMLFLSAFAIVGLGHYTILMPFWPQSLSQYLMQWAVKAFCTLGMASLSCAVVFAAVGLMYRRELNYRRAQLQQLTTPMNVAENSCIVALPVEADVDGSIAEDKDCDLLPGAA